MEDENSEHEDSHPQKNDSEKRTLPEFRSNREVLLFLFLMIRENKKWWLLPMLFVLAILCLFVGLTGNSSILPAIYALF